MPAGVSTGAAVDNPTAAHIGQVVKGLLLTTLVVDSVAVWTHVDVSVAALVFQVVEAGLPAAFVVGTWHTVGIRARTDVAMAAHQICVVKVYSLARLNVGCTQKKYKEDTFSQRYRSHYADKMLKYRIFDEYR